VRRATKVIIRRKAVVKLKRNICMRNIFPFWIENHPKLHHHLKARTIKRRRKRRR
jgi:hypothetical protein